MTPTLSLRELALVGAASLQPGSRKDIIAAAIATLLDDEGADIRVLGADFDRILDLGVIVKNGVEGHFQAAPSAVTTIQDNTRRVARVLSALPYARPQ